MADIRVQSADFDPGAEMQALQEAAPYAGGVATFLGLVRSDPTRRLCSLTLEHYPAMTQAAIARIAEQAELRFSLSACTIIHRHGCLMPGERIVFVGVAASHRRPALEGAAFLIDWLKTKAPFWKKEAYEDGESGWVAALQEDEEAAERWGG